MANGFYKAVYQIASSTYDTVSYLFKADHLDAAVSFADANMAAIGFASPKLIYVGFTGTAKPAKAVGVFMSSGAW